MDQLGAEGTITGTINWYDDTGTLVIDDLVTGEIVNDMDYNSRYYEFDITSNNNEVTLSGYYGTYASSIDDNDFIIASYQAGNENGTWHTCPADSATETCDIESIITLDTEVSIQDLCWTDTSLYAVIFDDPAIGEVQSLVIGCLYPRGITCDGTNFWVLNIEETIGYTSTLYKYTSSWVLEDTVTVPDHGMYGNVPTEITWWNDSIASYIEGNFFDDGIKLISPETGSNTILIPQSIPRVSGLAAASNGFWTRYFAPGDSWCELGLYNTEGNVIKSIYFPLNFVGPLASDGVDIWISLGQYIFRISGD